MYKDHTLRNVFSFPSGLELFVIFTNGYHLKILNVSVLSRRRSTLALAEIPKVITKVKAYKPWLTGIIIEKTRTRNTEYEIFLLSKKKEEGEKKKKKNYIQIYSNSYLCISYKKNVEEEEKEEKKKKKN